MVLIAKQTKEEEERKQRMEMAVHTKVKKVPKVKLKASERIALQKETLNEDSYKAKLRMIMKANRVDKYELPDQFPGIDETLEFKEKLSSLYNNTKDRREKII